MDLSLDTLQGKLNIRTCVLIKRQHEWLLHQGKKESFATAIGGRIKFGEDSKHALVREIHEELNLNITVDELELITIVESFFEYNQTPFHEYLFVYQLDVGMRLGQDKQFIQPDPDFDYFFCDTTEINRLSIKPEILKTILLGQKVPCHYINDERKNR